MVRGRARAAVAAAALAAACGAPGAADPPGAPVLARDTREAATFRGSLVFSTYCITCHGVLGDGNGRAARLYVPRPSNLRASDKNDAYLKLIVVNGGPALGRSPFMPAWYEELTDEQIADVVAFMRSINVSP